MSSTNIVRLASVRVITDDVARSVAFYQLLTGVAPNHLTDDFVELATPTATVAVSGRNRVPFVAYGDPGAGGDESVIVEFLVDDAKALFEALQSDLGDDLDVVQEPITMPWGNVSALIRDPDGLILNLYTPVTPDAWQLQLNRTPKIERTVG